MLHSTKWFSGFLIVGTIFLSACKSSETTPTDRVTLGMNQSARLGSDVTIRVDSIQDSRCPTCAVCVCFWAGQAKVKLLLATNSDSSTVRLAFGIDINAGSKQRLDSTNVTLSSVIYKVILRGVNPYPSYPPTNEPQVAIVQVTKI